MARALLREDQMGDRDNLSEHEHEVLVHESLVTSGTLNFQDGTISGTGDVYATTFYGDGSQLSGLSAEPSSIYYSSSARATATTNGIQITDGTNTGNLGYHGPAGALTLTNTQHGAGIWMYGEDNAGSNKTLFFADPDGAVRLYHAGAQTLFTKAGGFYFQNGGDQAYISLSTDIYYHNHVHGGRHLLKAEQTDGTNVFTAVLDPDGAAELYYAGAATLRTYNLSGAIQGFEYGDFSSSGATAAIGRIYQNGSGTFVQNDYHNGYLQIQGQDSGGATSNWLQLKDSGSTLFNDNYATLVMRGGGFYVKDSAANTGSIYYASGSMVFYGDTNETSFIFRAKDTNGDVKNMMVTDPDGAAELYYAGTKTFETTSNGADVAGRIYCDPVETGWGNSGIRIIRYGGGYRHLYTNSTGGELRFYNGSNEPYIDASGNWHDASDASLKTNVEDLDYGVDEVMNLQPRRFDYTTSSGGGIGFIAQELEQIIPEVVSGEDGSKGVAYGQLVSVLCKAIQEQQATISGLEARISALEA